MAEGKVDNRGSACGSDAQPDPPQIPMAEASQQDTVWRCVAVYGIGGFLFALPDTPHLLTKKMILSLARKVLRSALSFGIGCPSFPGQAKKKAEAFASTFSFPLYFSFFPKTGM